MKVDPVGGFARCEQWAPFMAMVLNIDEPHHQY
jgi:hypothetical protein